MHTWGKVFTWMMVPLALAAVYFTAQVINVRNSWTRAADTLQAENTAAQERIREKQATLDRLRSDYSRLLRPWERVFDAKDVRVGDQNTGIIGASIGVNSDRLQFPLANPLPMVHGFSTPQEGQSAYVGPFQITDARNDNSDLRIDWPIVAGEEWPSGRWRFWQKIPQQHENSLRRQVNDLNAANERLAKAESLLRRANDRLAEAEAQIAARVKEIEEGLQDPNRPKLPPEDLLGLTKASGDAEAARNQTLREVQELRKQIQAANSLLGDLVEQNTMLSQGLPQPPAETAASGERTVLE